MTPDPTAEAQAALHHDEAYFRNQFDRSDDPWGFDDRWYERRKFALTLAALPRERYERAFEPGCANGALTELLAPRCGTLIASELLADVAGRAAERTRHLGNVEVHCEPFPQWWPSPPIDLVVLSEVAYYLTCEGRRVFEDTLRARLESGGDVIAVHYTGVTNYPMPGRTVAMWLDGIDFLERIVHHVDPEFELAVWRRVPTVT